MLVRTKDGSGCQRDAGACTCWAFSLTRVRKRGLAGWQRLLRRRMSWVIKERILAAIEVHEQADPAGSYAFARGMSQHKAGDRIAGYRLRPDDDEGDPSRC